MQQDNGSAAVAAPFDQGQAKTGRIIRRVSIGDVQAFPARPGEVSIALSVYANVTHQATETAYVHNSMYLDAADARNLAVVLIEAADHADAVRIGAEQQEAA